MSVFDKRVTFKPFEYPELIKYKDAINHSYWLISEWNFTSDINDFHSRLTSTERSVIKSALLAISQIEISVKTFWAKLGDKFPKSEFGLTGITFGESECFDKETEILTKDGWKFFKDINKNTDVAQYDIKNGEISFTKPSYITVKDFDGHMHHYNSLGTDLMITPNHELLLMHPQKDFFEKKISSKGKWGHNYRYPCAGMGVSKKPLLFNDLHRLLIAIQADGCLYGNCPTGKGRRDFAFTLSKKRKIDRLLQICKDLNIELYIKEKENKQLVLSGFLPAEAPEVSTIKGFDYIPIECVDENFGNSFLEELKHWDSSINNESFSYYNSNISAIDKVQAICVLSNRCSHKGVNRTDHEIIKSLTPDGKVRKSSKTIYALNITKNNKKTYPYKNIVTYKDKVYCVTVPKGNIVTRRNSRVAISGNCRHADAYSHLLEILGFNNEFDQLLQNPVIQGRVDYLTKYLKGSADNSNENFTLTLALFSLFIENVSLFSQFLIIKSFNKYKNYLKDIDNVVQATQQEEQLHALFGIEVIKIIQKEFPEWFNEAFYGKVERACKKAYQAECNIIDWIFSAGEISFLSKEVVKEFTKDRFNQSINMIGGNSVFEVNQELLSSVKWFDDEILSNVNSDFFYKRPTTYSKKVKPIKATDLF